MRSGGRRLVWFRKDLRLHDNETLSAALSDASAAVAFLFVYDEAWDRLTPEKFAHFGPFRKRFIAESVIDLRDRLRALGKELICAIGKPTEIVPTVVQALNIDQVYHTYYTTKDETDADKAIADALREKSIDFKCFHTHSMLHPDDIPQVNSIRSGGYTKLKNIVEKSHWKIRPPKSAPTEITNPSLHFESPDVVLWRPEDCPKCPEIEKGIHVKGGESEALKRLKHYFWDADRLRVYKNTRNGLIKLDDSSKFSAALSLGCLSARQIYAEVRRYEREKSANASTTWFLYELIWRDHFHFLAAHRGGGLFTDKAANSTDKADNFSDKVDNCAHQELERFEAWRLGKTGNAFIDAAMIELRATGWMSNRMRQNVASFLIFDLGVTWQWGARWFQSCLFDYDCASNWGNWSYIAGAGPMNTPHVFDVNQQAKAYDADNAYARLWQRRTKKTTP